MVWACHWWRFYSLAGVNGLGVSLGEMSGNDIAMSGGEMWAVSPIPCFIGSVASSGGRLYSLAGVNGLGVSLSPASSARWLPLVGGSISLQGVNGLGVSLVAVLFPCRFGRWSQWSNLAI